MSLRLNYFILKLTTLVEMYPLEILCKQETDHVYIIFTIRSSSVSIVWPKRTVLVEIPSVLMYEGAIMVFIWITPLGLCNLVGYINFNSTLSYQRSPLSLFTIALATSHSTPLQVVPLQYSWQITRATFSLNTITSTLPKLLIFLTPFARSTLFDFCSEFLRHKPWLNLGPVSA